MSDQTRRLPRTRTSPFLQHHFATCRAAVRRRQDRHVAVPGHRNPAVRRPVRGLRHHAGRGTPKPSRRRTTTWTAPWASINTVVLLVSSFTMVMAVHAARTDKRKQLIVVPGADPGLRRRLPGHQVRRVLAQVPRGAAARQVLFTTRATPSPASSMFFSFYFMMTGLHGIHILVGMGAIGWVLRRAVRGDFSSALLHAGGPGRALLAPGGSDLDLPVPADVPDQLGSICHLTCHRLTTTADRSSTPPCWPRCWCSPESR